MPSMIHFIMNLYIILKGRNILSIIVFSMLLDLKVWIGNRVYALTIHPRSVQCLKFPNNRLLFHAYFGGMVGFSVFVCSFLPISLSSTWFATKLPPVPSFLKFSGKGHDKGMMRLDLVAASPLKSYSIKLIKKW